MTEREILGYKPKEGLQEHLRIRYTLKFLGLRVKRDLIARQKNHMEDEGTAEAVTSMCASREWSNAHAGRRECGPRVLYPAKLSLNCENSRQTFLNM